MTCCTYKISGLPNIWHSILIIWNYYMKRRNKTFWRRGGGGGLLVGLFLSANFGCLGFTPKSWLLRCLVHYSVELEKFIMSLTVYLAAHLHSLLPVTPRTYAAVTPSRKPVRKSHVRQFSRYGVGRGYLVVVTGSTWQLRDLHGSYGIPIATSMV